MSRTKTPEQHQAEYNWLTPSQVAGKIGVESADTVRQLIRDGHLSAMDVSRSSRPSYRIPQAEVDRYITESFERVREAS